MLKISTFKVPSFLKIRQPRSVSPEEAMPIRVLVADSSGGMRHAIVRVLREEALIEVVGEATSFAETLELTASLQPDVLLLDPHMPDEREYPPELVKPRILLNTKCIVAISFWNDADASDLAKTFGAVTLLDKTKLYLQLIPAIKQFCPKVVIPEIVKPFRTTLKKPAPIATADAA
jgi:DNA-binding NarL/FixJ family response regulator